MAGYRRYPPRPMTTRQSRRKLIVIVLLFIAVGGAVIRQLVPPPSTLRDIGTLMLLLWIPVIGNVVAWFFGKVRVARQAAKAARATEPPPAAPVAPTATGAFAADLIVEFTLRAAAVPAEDLPIAEGEHQCAFVVGNEGFSARWQVPDGKSFYRGTAQVLEAQFLSPTLALPKFEPGTAFRMLIGDAFIGDGQVREVLAPRAMPRPSQG